MEDRAYLQRPNRTTGTHRSGAKPRLRIRQRHRQLRLDATASGLDANSNADAKALTRQHAPGHRVGTQKKNFENQPNSLRPYSAINIASAFAWTTLSCGNKRWAAPRVTRLSPPVLHFITVCHFEGVTSSKGTNNEANTPLQKPYEAPNLKVLATP